MKTKELYYDDPMLHEFVAQVLSCEPIKDGYGIALDCTAFYPEGGGQPGDRGSIGGVAVRDTRKINGEIVHITSEPVDLGKAVCTLDFKRRFALMQNHTGEHILSGVLKREYGCENVGFHMGEEYVAIDTDVQVSPEQLIRGELLANEAIYRNLEIIASYPDPQKLAELDYRSKGSLAGDVRVVDIPGYDICACCGTHCLRTGDVGIIKILTSQRYKGGTRIYMLCGMDALLDYGRKNEEIYELSMLLSAKPTEVVSAVRQLFEERNQLRAEKGELRKIYFEHKVREIPQGEKVAVVFEQGLSADELRRYCLVLAARAEVVFLFCPGPDGGFKYAIGSKIQDVREIGKQINAAFEGKGGGQKELVQGSVFAGQEEIAAFIAALNLA